MCLFNGCARHFAFNFLFIYYPFLTSKNYHFCFRLLFEKTTSFRFYTPFFTVQNFLSNSLSLVENNFKGYIFHLSPVSNWNFFVMGLSKNEKKQKILVSYELFFERFCEIFQLFSLIPFDKFFLYRQDFLNGSSDFPRCSMTRKIIRNYRYVLLNLVGTYIL